MISATESTISTLESTEVDEPAGLPSSLPASPLGSAEYGLGNEDFLSCCEVLSASFNPSDGPGPVVQLLGDDFGSAGMTGVACALDLVDLLPPAGFSPMFSNCVLWPLAPCNFSEEETDGVVEETYVVQVRTCPANVNRELKEVYTPPNDRWKELMEVIAVAQNRDLRIVLCV